MKKRAKLMLGGAVLLSVVLGASAQTTQPTSVLQTDSGPIRGAVNNGMNSYLGIPYAAPPVGALRWMPPRRPNPWKAVREAGNYGSSCPQGAYLGVFGKAGGSEDCLNLNVFVSTQAVQSGRKLPVLVWIHGGALKVGSSRDYDAGKLARDGRVVVVTINYRLGVLGFFAHPAIDKEHHNVANYGLLDQNLALDWVQRNIAAFEGDPGNVTIFGESSGGNSVFWHIASPISAGKFQHAIAMSGATGMLKFPAVGSPRPLDFAEDRGLEFAKAAGCGGQGADCLRKLSLDQILALQQPYMFSQVIIDGKIMPMPPADALRSGKFNHVTLINGSTLDEGTFFVGFPENETGKPIRPEDYGSMLERFYGKDLAQEILKEYPQDRYNSPSEAYAAADTDSQFACPARAVDRWLSDKIPVYAYEFADTTAPSYLQPTTFTLLAAHTFELPYIFAGFHGGAGVPVALNSLQNKLSEVMIKYWANAGHANDTEAEWPQYDTAKDNFLRFTLPEPRMISQNFSAVHHCEYWDKTGRY